MPLSTCGSPRSARRSLTGQDGRCDVGGHQLAEDSLDALPLAELVVGDHGDHPVQLAVSHGLERRDVPLQQAVEVLSALPSDQERGEHQQDERAADLGCDLPVRGSSARLHLHDDGLEVLGDEQHQDRRQQQLGDEHPPGGLPRLDHPRARNARTKAPAKTGTMLA